MALKHEVTSTWMFCFIPAETKVGSDLGMDGWKLKKKKKKKMIEDLESLESFPVNLFQVQPRGRGLADVLEPSVYNLQVNEQIRKDEYPRLRR